VTEQAYKARIKCWIEAALSKGHLSFNELVRLLPGVHPVDVAHYVQNDGRVRTTLNCPGAVIEEPSHDLKLPVPHPLEYDWRFVQSSRELLLSRALENTKNSDSVILLGAPTVYRAALETNFPRRVILIDANPYVSVLSSSHMHGTILATDVTSEKLPDIYAQTVITDPPWYEVYTRSFLWSAAHLTRTGGAVLLSTPPIGTRPGIQEEWSCTLEFADNIGLQLVATEQVLRYRMPPFERNALRAAGQHYIDQDWRPGVLATFVRNAATIRQPRPIFHPDQNDWAERSISGVRFKLRQQSVVTCIDPRLVKIVPGDVLDSVSRRDPRRSLVDVWTSGNRVFRCLDNQVLLLVMDALSAGTPAAGLVEHSLGRVLTSEERAHIERAANRVIEIADIENQEYVSEWEG
jgi:hypothetical protein